MPPLHSDFRIDGTEEEQRKKMPATVDAVLDPGLDVAVEIGGGVIAEIWERLTD